MVLPVCEGLRVKVDCTGRENQGDVSGRVARCDGRVRRLVGGLCRRGNVNDRNEEGRHTWLSPNFERAVKYVSRRHAEREINGMFVERRCQDDGSARSASFA
jgi:hypothetical protein